MALKQVYLPGGGGGATNWQQNQKPAGSISQVNSGTYKPSTSTGFGVAPTNPVAMVDEKPALGISQVHSGTPVKPAPTPALSIVSLLNNRQTPQNPAAEIVRAQYDLVHRTVSGPPATNAATNLGPQNWTNPANAQGAHNAVNATAVGNLTAAQDFNLKLDYDNFTNKSGMTITAVKLYYYLNQTGTSLNNGALEWFYSLDGGTNYTSVPGAKQTADVNFMTTPSTKDFAGALPTWAQLDLLTVKIRFNPAAAANLVNAAVDAVELEVMATLTEAL